MGEEKTRMETSENIQINKKNKLRKIQIALDIIFIILLLCASIWVATHWDELNLLVSNPCKLCEEKTGGICYSNPLTNPEVNIPFNISLNEEHKIQHGNT